MPRPARRAPHRVVRVPHRAHPEDLDTDFPEVAAELLDVLYPQYLRPVPSMAVARFDFDPERAKLTTGFVIAKHTQLFAVADRARSAACALPIRSRSGP